MTVLRDQYNGSHDAQTDYRHEEDQQSFQRTLPCALDAEQSVLGGMLLSKQAVIECQDIVRAADYYKPAHAMIHNCILDLTAKGEPADPITVGAELTKNGLIGKAGGPSYLHGLVQTVPTAANAGFYADIVHEKAVLRRLIEAGTRIVQSGYSPNGADSDEVVAAAAAEIATVVEGSDQGDDFVPIGDAIESTLDAIENAKSATGLVGLPTGFTDLDCLTNGFKPGQMIIVAARPAMGKSTLALDFARAAAIKHGRPAAFLSLEMGREELTMRMLSAEARVALHHLQSGELSDDDWTRLARRMPDISAAPLYINDCATSLGEIQAKLRRLKARDPRLALVVIDYMQLVTLSGRRPEVREREVAEVSRSFKLLAKELQVPMVVLAQLNRESEKRQDKKPVASDLRESGSQEQDADIIILLHREDAYEKDSPRAGEADLILAKHRNGPTRTVTVAFQGHYGRFVDMAQT
ncbi:replicative DNA helicase [Streptomyces sp. SHP22-7]|nr:replicative DNA helicase [Streptomyces sp. SHP22-7]